MKILATVLAFLTVMSASSQIELTSIGFNIKGDFYSYNDSNIDGLEFAFQTVLDQNFIVNVEYSKLGDNSIGNGGFLWGVNRGTFLENLTTVGGNVGYRLHANDKFKFDLTAGLHHFKLEERYVYDVDIQDGNQTSFQTQTELRSIKGIGPTAAVRANWLFSKYAGLNIGFGLQRLQDFRPFVQIGLEFGWLRR